MLDGPKRVEDVSDFIAINSRILLPLGALASGLFGALLLVLAWRSRRRRVGALVGATMGVASLLVAWSLAGWYRMNRYTYELEDRTGTNVSSYRMWTVEEGVEHQISEFRGRPVLLYLWATHCGPCRLSLPVLAQLAVALQGRASVVLLSTEDRETLLAFSESYAIPGVAAYAPEPLIPSGSSWVFPQAPRPTLFLIDGKGVVQSVMVGSRAGAHLRQLAKNPRAL